MSFWVRVQSLKGQALQTRSRRKVFDVLDVTDDKVILVPRDGNGTQRPLRRAALEQAAALQLHLSELNTDRLRQEFPDDQNLSYMAGYSSRRPSEADHLKRV